MQRNYNLLSPLPGGAKRYINGQCTGFTNAPQQGRHYGYTTIIRPWL